MDDVRVNDKKVLENVAAVLDTSSNFIYGDLERVAELYRPLGGASEKHGGFDYYYRES
jgi:hypothetical protein